MDCIQSFAGFDVRCCRLSRRLRSLLLRSLPSQLRTGKAPNRSLRKLQRPMLVRTRKTNLRLLEAYYAIRRRKRRHGFSVAGVPGLKLWVRAESLVSLANNTAVATWKDESGHGSDL